MTDHQRDALSDWMSRNSPVALFRGSWAGGVASDLVARMGHDELESACGWGMVRAAETFDQDKGSFEGWAVKWMSSAVGNAVRKKWHERWNDGDPWGEDRPLVEAMDVATVREAVGDDADAAVVRRAFGLGVPQETDEQIAASMGLSRTRVWQRKKRRLKELRDHPVLAAWSNEGKA